MATFRAQSKEFLGDLSRAAAWMMRRSAGQNHWWRSSVLTTANGDTDKNRPVFDQARADQIFADLISRGLLIQRADDVDGMGLPSYTMKYDIDGWDQAVADGRQTYAIWLKVRRTWILILITFLLGCVVTTIENRISGLLDGLIDRVVGTVNEEPNKAVDSTATRVTPPAPSLRSGQEPRHGQP
jgi:hypothetical protein